MQIPQIYGWGLSSVAGSDSATAAENILQQKHFSERDPDCIGPDGQEQVLAAKFAFKQERNIITRLRKLFDEAYQECLQSLDGKVELKRKITMYMALPDWLKSNDELKQAFEAEFNRDTPKQISRIQTFHAAHCGGLQALFEACTNLHNGTDQAAFVCSLDSHIAPFLLDYVNMAEGAIADGNPYGIVPGEAAAIVYLSTRSHTASVKPAAQILNIAWHKEEHAPGTNTKGMPGRALSNCFFDVTSRLPQNAELELIIGDLNGQRFRAEEFGFAVSALAQKNEAVLNPLTPALSIGDVGAATGIVYVIIALHNNYAEHPYGLIWTSAVQGQKYAITLKCEIAQQGTCG